MRKPGVMLAVLALAVGTAGCKTSRLVPWDLPSVPDPLAAVENDPRWPSLERSMVFHPVRYPAGDWQPRGLAFRGRLVPGGRRHASCTAGTCPHESPGPRCSSATATPAT